jgi:large subunit ribosomal protein L31
MKTDIHPEYKTVTVHCSCGNSFETRSTAKGDELRVELCSECHPFYTGKQKLVDTGGRIDRFERRYGRRKKAGGDTADDAAETPAGDAGEPADATES